MIKTIKNLKQKFLFKEFVKKLFEKKSRNFFNYAASLCKCEDIPKPW